MDNPVPIYFTVKQFCERHPWPTLGGLRWIIYQNKKNKSFLKCITRIGRRILINEKKFFEFVGRQGP